tara:strand:- start:48 stop:560 length:513 start_codon:yes stop_codon:yes gene_type:complete
MIISFFLISCSQVRESAGVTRKSLDEFKAIENPPLVIPPDYDLVAPKQANQKIIDNADKELAEEILFGLEESIPNDEQQSSTMNKILENAKVKNAPENIREEIDEQFAKEKKTDGVFQIEWENEYEVLDAIKESERIRNKNFKGESIADGEVPIKKEKEKIKKKKRFFFF